MADDKRSRGDDPRHADLGADGLTPEQRAERGRQAAAQQAMPQNPSAAKRKLAKEIDAGKVNLTEQAIAGHLTGILQAAGKDPREAKQLAKERAAEMCSDEKDDEDTLQ